MEQPDGHLGRIGHGHKPLFFEEPQLERYGHSTGPFTQPLVSAADFVGRLPLLPYYAGVYTPNENIYDLGDYRPGSCAPYYIEPFPISIRGLLLKPPQPWRYRSRFEDAMIFRSLSQR